MRDIADLGPEKALAAFRKVDSGWKVGHAFSGFLALLDVCVIGLALAACIRGFQTIVVAALGLIYSTLNFRSFGASGVDANGLR